MKIFIGYRHEDTEHATGRIYERIESKYGKRNVFKDDHSIPIGMDFRPVIIDGVAKCDVMLAVIGRQWLNVTDRNGYRRLDDPRDYVRLEIELALARAIPVIPVIVQDAVMPHEVDLPPTLAPLVYKNGIKLHGDPYFEGCLDLLIARLDELSSTLSTLGLSDAPTNETGNIIELIRRKSDGGALPERVIAALVNGYMSGAIPDAQMAALLMAIRIRGMNPVETAALTLAMLRSGTELHVRNKLKPVADKHSTGGVGDKVTLVAAPLIAACGLPVGKISGRSLGHTGGTIDKLESIAGLRTELQPEEFLDILQRHGLALSAHSPDLAPADGKMYALRDATATVDSLPLIAASIMSKKLAVGPSHLLLDVKVGVGAFMKTKEEARELAEVMVRIGKDAGVHTCAVLSAMDQPLGCAVGNAIEVAEAIATLRGEGPEDVTTLCLHEVATLLTMAGLVRNEAEGERRARKAIANGAGLAKLRDVVAAQGGDPAQIDEPKRLPRAGWVGMLTAPRSGYIVGIHAAQIGKVSVRLGAARARRSRRIDPAVGIVLQAKAGDNVEEGQPLIEIHARSATEGRAVRSELLEAYTWSDERVAAQPLLLGSVSSTRT